MKIDAYFDNVVLFDVQYQMNVLKGQSFTLVMDAAEGIEVFANNDKVLEVEHSGTEIGITSLDLGPSKIRLMTGDVVTKELLIVVVDQIGLPTADLGLTVSVEPKL